MAPRFNQIKYYSGGGAQRTLSGPNVKIPKFVEPKIPPGVGAQAVQGLSKVAAAFFKADKDKKDKAAKRADEDAATRMIEALTARFDPTKYGASPQTLMAAAEEMPEGEEDDAWAAPSPEDQREFYTDQANKTQSDYGSTYGAGLVRANQARGDYNTQDTRDWWDKLRDVDKPKEMGPESRSTMRKILLGDMAKTDAAGLLSGERAYKKEVAKALAASKLAAARAKLTDDPTSNMRDFKELQRLQVKYPPIKGKDSPEVATFKDFVRATKIMNLGDRYLPYDPSKNQSLTVGLPSKRYQKGKTIVTLPSVPGTGQGANNRTNSATVSRDGAKVAQLPVTDKQLSAEINSEVRPMVEARRTGQLALDLMDANKDNLIPVSGTFSKILNWNSDSDQGILKSYIENLKSPNVLGAMMSLKAASPTGSTGFGQLNIKELDILINRLGALNVNETNVKVLRRSIVSINNSFDNVISMVKKNVPEKKLKELGLHKLFYPTSVPISQMNLMQLNEKATIRKKLSDKFGLAERPQ